MLQSHLRSLAISSVGLVLLACQSEDPADNSTASQSVLQSGPGRDGLRGWNILSPDYEAPSTLDGISFEWDYFMVHSEDGAFTGSIGYLYANPRDAGGLGDLLPKGGNAAVAGLFADGSRVAEYRNFGVEHTEASSDERFLYARDEATGEFARISPQRASSTSEDSLRLEGTTAELAWDLRVTQDWPGLSSSEDLFSPMHGDDVGTMLDGESWNVNMLWPRTRVEGTVTRLDTGAVVPVKGHGYRENSWGRWAFNTGGWDFAVVSDEQSGVAWAWQSYHAKSVELDYLDLGFVEDDTLRLVQFHAARGELGWSHPSWTFDAEARVCIPLTTRVVAQNDEYRVEADVDLASRQVPMLSDATGATKQYVIMIQFPHVEGTIVRRADGETIAEFSGQGGGEFSNARSSATSMTDEECNAWGEAFASPMP